MTQIMGFQTLDIKNQTFFFSFKHKCSCIIWRAGQDLSPPSTLMQDISLGGSGLTVLFPKAC